MKPQEEKEPSFAEKMHGRLLPYHIIYRNYLRPFEILLRTHKTDTTCQQGRRTSLPQGLMIASKLSINDNTYIRLNLDPRNGLPQRGEKTQVSCDKIEGLMGQHRNNFLNLLKEVNNSEEMPKMEGEPQDNPQTQANINQADVFEDHLEGFELAICVCVYSEDAKMLKQTLAGIKENVIDLVKSGVKEDAIGVFVFFDGVEKVHPSILEYIERLQNQSINIKPFGSSNSAWDDYMEVQRGRREFQDFFRTEAQKDEQKIFDQHILRILFNQAELKDRQERTFKRVYECYMSMVALKEEIIRLKNDREITSQKLPPKVLEQFNELVGKQYQDHHDQIGNVVKNMSKQEERRLCMKALIETEIFCNIFLSARSDLAYLFMHQELIYSKTVEELVREEQMRINGNLGRPYFEVIMPPPPGEEDIQRPNEPCQIHLNLFFTVKYKNEGKLSSHNWFLNGFCKQLKPNFMILMDVGLKPKKKAIFIMYHHLKANPRVGGVCGYMSLRIERTQQEEEIQAEEVDCLTNLAHKVVDIQRAQQIQYHFAHLLDKPFESLFNFIHVLPGAFSGYNMRAIHSPLDKDETILRKYFESLNDKLTENHIVESELTLPWMAAKVLLPDFIASIFLTTDPDSEEQMLCNENMNLAEDRILCFGIHKNGFDLAYLPDAYSEVDPIKTLHGLLGQRKRWINGSFFAFQKVKQELSAFEKSKNTFQVILKIQIFYLNLVNAASYFSVSLFLFTVHIAMRSFYADFLQSIFHEAFKSQRAIPFFINTMDFIYILIVFAIVYYSLNLTHSNKHFCRLIYVCSTLLGILAIVVYVVLAYSINQMAKIDSEITSFLKYSVLIMLLLHIVPIILYSIMHKKFQLFVEMISGAFSFIYYNPTYLIILNIYALCRMDDISWGTKGIDSDIKNQSKVKQKWRRLKFVHVFKYLLWNMVLSVTLISVEDQFQTRVIITLVIVFIISSILVVKFVLGFIYSLKYKFKHREVVINQLPPDVRFMSIVNTRIRSNLANNVYLDFVESNIRQFMGNQPRV